MLHTSHTKNLEIWGQTYKIHLTTNLATINSYKIVMKLSMRLDQFPPPLKKLIIKTQFPFYLKSR